MSTQHKSRHFCFSFFWRLVHFHYPPSHPAVSINLPLLGKQEALGLPCGGRLRGRGKSYLPLQYVWRYFSRWVYPGGSGLRKISRGGYRMCGCSLVRRNLIDVPFLWILQISGLLQGTSSFSYPKMGIRRSSRFELDLLSWGSGNSLCLSIFPRWIEGVGFLPPCSLFAETLPDSLLSHLISSYPWIPPGRHLDRFRGRFLGGSSVWIIQEKGTEIEVLRQREHPHTWYPPRDPFQSPEPTG